MTTGVAVALVSFSFEFEWIRPPTFPTTKIGILPLGADNS